ncbi:MAG: histidine--tRNA ligase [Anaerolineae bacterium]
MAAGSTQPARGTRDALPGDMRRRQHVLDVLRDIFLAYGFEPLDTPAIERADTLLGKYGPDAERLIYRAGLSGKDDLALRYDLTVPLARVAGSYDELSKPIKRYQVAAVWRGERPQRGRYREFLQADVDIVGSSSMLADAEIITIVATALERLGFPDHLTMVNNRKVLLAVGRYAGVPESVLPGLYRAIDKRDKIGLEGVRQELRAVGVPGDLVHRERQAVGRWMRGQADRDRLAADLAQALAESVPSERAAAYAPAVDQFLESLCARPQADGVAAEEIASAKARLVGESIEALRALAPDAGQIPDEVVERLLALLSLSGDNLGLLGELESELGDAPGAREGIGELRELLQALEDFGVPTTKIAVDFAMVRGLDYYTGTIFETVIESLPIGSILSGGRYDNLMSQFGRDLPAVGTSFGVDRLVLAMDETELFPPEVDGPTPEVLVTRFDEPTTGAAVRLAQLLREAGLRTELYLDVDRLGDQIRYALRRQIPLLAICGPDEVAAGTATLRDLRLRVEQTVPVAGVVEAARAMLEAAPPAQ